MANEQLPTHDYFFDRDGHVDPGCLEQGTKDTVDYTNHAYRDDRAEYVRETYAALGRSNEDQPFAHFRRPGDSKTDVALLINPFGTPIESQHNGVDMSSYVQNRGASRSPRGIEPNEAGKLFQGRLLYDGLCRTDVVDRQGKNIAVLVVSSPSLDYSPELSKAELRLMASGDFTALAVRALRTVVNLKYRRIYGLGYSLGTIAGKAVELAANHDIEVIAGCYVGDAPHFKNRQQWGPLPIGIIGAYTLDSHSLSYSGDWRTADGPEPRADIARHGEHYDAFGNWFGNGNIKTNLAILRGLSVDGFSGTLDYMNRNNIPTSTSWSEGWLMRGFADYINLNPAARELAAKHILQLFRARNAPHISGENQVFLTDVMTRAICFAHQIR